MCKITIKDINFLDGKFAKYTLKILKRLLKPQVMQVFLLQIRKCPDFNSVDLLGEPPALNFSKVGGWDIKVFPQKRPIFQEEKFG